MINHWIIKQHVAQTTMQKDREIEAATLNDAEDLALPNFTSACQHGINSWISQSSES